MVRAIDMFGDDAALQEHWVRRVLASIIDWVIISLVFSSLLIALPIVVGLGLSISLVSPSSLIAGIFPLLYFGLLEGMSGGKTAGKALMNLKVVGTVDDMDFRKAFIRNLSKLFGVFLLLDVLLGLIRDGDPRQRLLDRIAGTVVVRTNIQETFRGVYPPAGQFSAFERRDAPPFEMAPAGPGSASPGECKMCTSCGSSATLIAGIDRWFCYKCRKYI